MTEKVIAWLKEPIAEEPKIKPAEPYSQKYYELLGITPPWENRSVSVSKKKSHSLNTPDSYSTGDHHPYWDCGRHGVMIRFHRTRKYQGVADGYTSDENNPFWDNQTD